MKITKAKKARLLFEINQMAKKLTLFALEYGVSFETQSAKLIDKSMNISKTENVDEKEYIMNINIDQIKKLIFKRNECYERADQIRKTIREMQEIIKSGEINEELLLLLEMMILVCGKYKNMCDDSDRKIDIIKAISSLQETIVSIRSLT